MKSQVKNSLIVLMLAVSFSCTNISGPDKSVEGTILGAGWGAGAGAVIGNQTGSLGPGAAVGVAFGAASGLLTGGGLDVQEGFNIQQQREINSLQVQVAANDVELRRIQASLDNRQEGIISNPSGTRIFFDDGRASLRMGSAVTLERLADAVKVNPYIAVVEIHGHSDDMGDSDKNQKLSEARAQTVATFLTEHGISSHVIKIIPHGATQPITTNKTPEGRQQNRRVEIVLR
ncbi:MAG: OmpA family protein [Deltaproteobacteria bacterium]|nr:OmpA family protein [Deltaproteobacteria bacterium]